MESSAIQQITEQKEIIIERPVYDQSFIDMLKPIVESSENTIINPFTKRKIKKDAKQYQELLHKYKEQNKLKNTDFERFKQQKVKDLKYGEYIMINDEKVFNNKGFIKIEDRLLHEIHQCLKCGYMCQRKFQDITTTECSDYTDRGFNNIYGERTTTTRQYDSDLRCLNCNPYKECLRCQKNIKTINYEDKWCQQCRPKCSCCYKYQDEDSMYCSQCKSCEIRNKRCSQCNNIQHFESGYQNCDHMRPYSYCNCQVPYELDECQFCESQKIWCPICHNKILKDFDCPNCGKCQCGKQVKKEIQKIYMKNGQQCDEYADWDEEIQKDISKCGNCEYSKKVGFGKYKDLTLAETYQKDKKYCRWYYDNCEKKEGEFYKYLRTKFVQ